MIVRLPREHWIALMSALKDAGSLEIGGILMGEHVGVDEFRVAGLTIQRRGGSIARFVRFVEHAITALRKFFRDTRHDFTRFNYLGEWHSHPLFEPRPSPDDDASMMKILLDDKVGARFVVLMIAKLENGEFVGSATLYTPSGRCAVTLAQE